jgi:hypothetical protein
MLLIRLRCNDASAAADSFGVKISVVTVKPGRDEGTGDSTGRGTDCTPRERADRCCHEPTGCYDGAHTRDREDAQSSEKTGSSARHATDGGTRACSRASIRRCNGFMAAVDVIRDEADIPRRDACRFKIAYRLRSIVISVE